MVGIKSGVVAGANLKVFCWYIFEISCEFGGKDLVRRFRGATVSRTETNLI